MKILLAVLLVLCHVAPVEAQGTYTGFAARYSPGLMEKVAKKRGIKRQECMVAATRESIGTWLKVTGLKSKVTMRCLVIDIPAERDRKAIERRNIVIELSHQMAAKICLSVVQRPEECKVRVTQLAQKSPPTNRSRPYG